MKTAIIALDFINDICHEKGKLARFADRIRHKCLFENANKLIEWARKSGHLVIHVRVGFKPDYLEASTVSPIFSQVKGFGALNLDEWGGQFCDEINIADSDVIVTKHRISAFYGTDLELVLRANKVERLVLFGVATNNAVELTAREAHDRDYHVTVVGDVTETNNDEEQTSSLNFLKKISRVAGIDSVITSQY